MLRRRNPRREKQRMSSAVPKRRCDALFARRRCKIVTRQRDLAEEEMRPGRLGGLRGVRMRGRFVETMRIEQR